MRSKLNKILIILLFATFFCSTKSFAALTNFEVLDSLASLAANDIFKNYLLEKDTIFYNIIGENADWLVEKKLLEQKKEQILINASNFEQNDLSFREKNAKKIVKIAIENISVNFLHLENSADSALRSAEVKLSIISNNPKSLAGEIEKFHKDTLHFDDLIQVNKANFAFAKAEIPAKNRTFWEKVLEPAIVVTTAAITTFLFFTIRSK